MVSKTQWVGHEGAAFERVGLAFEALGYRAPSADEGSQGAGAYAMNIIAQYRADLSEEEAEAIIAYGLRNARSTLESWKRDAGTRNGLRLSDLL